MEQLGLEPDPDEGVGGKPGLWTGCMWGHPLARQGQKKGNRSVMNWSRGTPSAGLVPKVTRDLDRINSHRVPPCRLVAGIVQFIVMPSAERNGELVAHLATERPRLSKARVMRV